MQALKDYGCHVLPLNDALEKLRAKTLPPCSVELTFDDGGCDFYRCSFQFYASLIAGHSLFDELLLPLQPSGIRRDVFLSTLEATRSHTRYHWVDDAARDASTYPLSNWSNWKGGFPASQNSCRVNE